MQQSVFSKLRLFRIMQDKNVHGVYSPISEALACDPRWSFTTIDTPAVRFLNGAAVPCARQFALLFSHFRFAIRVSRESDEGKNTVVREFVTIPLLLTLPLWWTRRHRLYFINNHNYQFAARSRLHRFALGLLIKVGMRVVSMEVSVRRQCRIAETRNDYVFPFPMAVPGARHLRRRAADTPRVGVLTGFRQEQRGGELLEHLREIKTMHGSPWRIVVASRFETALARHSGLADETLILRTEDDYWNALASFDVLVLNYDRTAYEYRTSGMISDAIAIGTPVVAPNFPVLAHQIHWPARAGLVFDDLGEIRARIETVLSWPPHEISSAAVEHIRIRGSRAFVELFAAL